MANGSANQLRLLITAVAAAIATPFLIHGAIQTMEGIHTSALHWLEPSDPERARYDRFTEQFEGGNFILLSWEGCTLDDPRLENLEAALASEAKGELGDAEPYIGKVVSGQSLFRELTQSELRLPDDQAVRRLQGSMIGPDGRQTCLAVVLSEHGGRQRVAAFDYLVKTAEEMAGVAGDRLHIAGPTVDALAIDVESDRSVDYYSGPSALVSFLFCAWCLRSFRFATAILAVAGFSELMVLGSLYYFGVTMDAVLIVLPPLVFVLSVSSGIHLVNYYYDQVRAGAGADAPRQAVLCGWMPCSLAALTTAIGLGSLLVSRIVPVCTFGQFASVGVIVAVLLLFLTLPGVMCRWPMPPERLVSGATTSAAVMRLVRMANVVCHHATLITILGMAMLVAGGIGLTHLRTSIGISNLFTADNPVVQDFVWIEENVANLVPLEVILTFPPEEDTLPMLVRLEYVEDVQAAIEGIGSVGGVMSVTTFAPEIPRTGGSRSMTQRGVLNAKLEESKRRLIDSHYLQESEEGQHWRISARISGVDDLDYEEVLTQLKETVEPQLDTLEEKFKVRPVADYTGTMPLVFHAQHTLLEDMYYSLVLAFVLIWLVMSYVFADFSGGLLAAPGALAKALWLGALAMLPNLFPIVVVFGVMGWLDWPADIGSTMTACVALGIAVDDTLHFLAWYRRQTAKGDAATLAIRHSFQHCGQAMIQTTVICGFGMLVFGLSGFMPTRRFSILMFTLLSAALVADLIFLPAILASPLGRLFAVKGAPQPVEQDAAA